MIDLLNVVHVRVGSTPKSYFKECVEILQQVSSNPSFSWVFAVMPSSCDVLLGSLTEAFVYRNAMLSLAPNEVLNRISSNKTLASTIDQSLWSISGEYMLSSEAQEERNNLQSKLQSIVGGNTGTTNPTIDLYGLSAIGIGSNHHFDFVAIFSECASYASECIDYKNSLVAKVSSLENSLTQHDIIDKVVKKLQICVMEQKNITSAALSKVTRYDSGAPVDSAMRAKLMSGLTSDVTGMFRAADECVASIQRRAAVSSDPTRQSSTESLNFQR